MYSQWKDKIFDTTPPSFTDMALEAFRFQYEQNAIYNRYVKTLGIDPREIKIIEDIPFLPISFFKSFSIQATLFEPEVIFESSGTTGTVNSRHLIKDVNLYKESFSRGFEFFYGPAKNWCIIGLLPSYLERQNSSLVYMADELIRQSGNYDSGFYLNEFEKLAGLLKELEERKQKTLLIGVTFALLDFAENFSMNLERTIIMETGGMKGRRKELIRNEVHDTLRKAFNVPVIHSEYGMTELLSQAYSKEEGKFRSPPWMKVLVRDDEDPLLVKKTGSGAINIIDLANIYSCSFIATDDVGRISPDGSFEVLGRMDNSDLRGCSLMSV